MGLRAGLDTEDRGKILLSLPGSNPVARLSSLYSDTILSYSSSRSTLNTSCVLSFLTTLSQ
jgi:hypothetical protein